MFNYGIGGQERKSDGGSEGISEIPLNRTLLIEQLTFEPAFKPEIIENLKTIEEVFQHFQPEVEVDFTTEEGDEIKEKLRFQGLAHFGKQGIISQSNYLQSLHSQANDYHKLIKQLKSNKILKKVLESAESRTEYLSVLKALVNELEEAEKGE